MEFLLWTGAGRVSEGAELSVREIRLNVFRPIPKEFHPRFLRRYLNLADEINGAVQNYISDVKARDFPNDKEQY